MNSVLCSRLGLVFCLLLAFCFFADALVGCRTAIPTGFLHQAEPWASEGLADSQDASQQYDLLFQFYPWARFFKDSLAAGCFPLWNPYNYLGTPFFANPQTALLFPLTWIHLLLPLELSFGWVFAFKLALALTGMLLFLRDEGLDPLAGLTGAAVYSLSMHTVVSLPFPYSSVTALLPWILFFSIRTFRCPGLKNWALTALTAALLILAGQPQSCLAAFLAVAVYAAIETLRRYYGTISGLKRATAVATAMLISIPLTAVQWLTSLQYVAESMVPDGPRIIKSGFPYAPGSFLTLIIPDFFGSHLRNDYWGFPGYHDIAFYASILVILLVPLAFAGRAWTCWQVSLAPAALFAAALLILLGVPPFEYLLDLPGFDLIRRNKLVVLLVFGMAHLAGLGVQRLIDGFRPRTSLLLALLAGWGALAAGAFWWFSPFLTHLDPNGVTRGLAIRTGILLILGVCSIVILRARWSGAALLALVLLDLIPLSYPLNPRGDARWLYPELALAKSLDGLPPRIYGLGGVFPPNSAQVYRLQDVRGYDVMTPRRTFRYMQAVDPSLGNAYAWLMGIDPNQVGPNTRMRRVVEPWLTAVGEPLIEYMKHDSYWSVTAETIHNPKLFRLLNFDYLLSPAGRADPLEGLGELSTAGDVRLYANPQAKRASLFTDWTISDSGRALSLMQEIDLSRTVVVEAPGLSQPDASASPPTLRQDDWSPERASFTTDSPVASVLVVFERYSPGWNAELEDGTPLDLFPADYIFRGVLVPKGRHTVTFNYQPSGFRHGILFSGVTLLALIVGLPLLGLVRRFRASGPPAAGRDHSEERLVTAGAVRTRTKGARPETGDNPRQSERERSECDSESATTAYPGSCLQAQRPRPPAELPAAIARRASHSLRSRSDLRLGAESASGQGPRTIPGSSKPTRFSRSSKLKFQVRGAPGGRRVAGS